ncbi:hypothetical protein [Lederbergia citri]|uniref:DUF3139 domain-containing protein n=1 Tax=Lederbergia citri TaxID=2833580 RepID=A0A942YI86_9BACI|nr:hypothetical protein [Lederbergia citri]MBS4197342.1 hypothetical protein [Lederbergia citri]
MELHPITVIEILASSIFIIALFVIAIFLPKRLRKMGLYIASLLMLLLLIFFAVRPFVHKYQFSQKKEYLHHYLVEKYPNERWEITKLEGRQYNRNYLQVKFENESEWIYMYLVKDKKKIYQVVWSPPDGKYPKEGLHYEHTDSK